MDVTKLALSVALATTLGLATQTSAQDQSVYEAGPDVTLPRVTKKVSASYELTAKQERVQGRVILQCVVSPDGRPTQIEVVERLDERLDANAVKALEQWEFEPGRRKQDDTTVPVRISVEMTFTLR